MVIYFSIFFTFNLTLANWAHTKIHATLSSNQFKIPNKMNTFSWIKLLRNGISTRKTHRKCFIYIDQILITEKIYCNSQASLFINFKSLWFFITSIEVDIECIKLLDDHNVINIGYRKETWRGAFLDKFVSAHQYYILFDSFFFSRSFLMMFENFRSLNIHFYFF